MSAPPPIARPPESRVNHAAGTGARVSTLRQDMVAGLINAVVSVPDGLASAALVGVNPVYGLYTSIAAAICGSLLVSAQLMQIATTSASALTAGQAIQGFPAAQRDQALFLLVLLTGGFLILFGLLRLGRLVRFVSFSVMTGFLIGVAVVLILDQLAPLVGFSPRGRNEIGQFLDLLAHASRFSIPTIVTGLLALGLAVGLARTRLKAVASLIALVVPSLLAALAGWEGVQRVEDVSPIPHGIPSLTVPNPALLTPELLAAAFALAVVIAVQGAGVSASVQNPDGTRVLASRDIMAQGAANIACGLFSGIPAGGSVGQTALNVSAGARSRWAGVLSGVWMLLFVLLLPVLVGKVPMAVLAALMIVAGVSAINVQEARSIWQTGWPSRLAGGTTLVATLFLPIQVAVGLGVVLSALLQLYASSTDVSLTRLTERPDGRIEAGPPPEWLSSEEVTVLEVHGHLFYAGAWTLERLLPAPEGAWNPVVILRLRDRTTFGATLIDVLDDYAARLDAVGGRLYLTGLGEGVYDQVVRTGKLRLTGPVRAYHATPILGESTGEALANARAWLVNRASGVSPDEETAEEDRPGGAGRSA